MKTILCFLLPIVCAAQSPKKDTTTVFPLGAVYTQLLKQQEELQTQYDDLEKAKQAFVIGFLSGRDKVITDKDSLVFINPNTIKILKKKK